MWWLFFSTSGARGYVNPGQTSIRIGDSSRDSAKLPLCLYNKERDDYKSINMYLSVCISYNNFNIRDVRYVGWYSLQRSSGTQRMQVSCVLDQELQLCWVRGGGISWIRTTGEHSIHKINKLTLWPIFFWKPSPGPLEKLYQSSSNGLVCVVQMD